MTPGAGRHSRAVQPARRWCGDGVMVLVWQDGVGSQALWGIPTAASVTDWVPIMR